LLPHLDDAGQSPGRHRVVHENDLRRDDSERSRPERDDFGSSRGKLGGWRLSQEALQRDYSRKRGSVLGVRSEDGDRGEPSKEVDEAALDSPSVH